MSEPLLLVDWSVLLLSDATSLRQSHNTVIVTSMLSPGDNNWNVSNTYLSENCLIFVGLLCDRLC